MKRIVLLLLLSATAAEAQIKTITGGGYQNSNGQPCAGCVLFLQLPVDATVIGTGQIVPNINSYILDANGNLPSGSTLWANDQLTPAGLTYKATLTLPGASGRIWGPEFLSISGPSPINLTQLIPVSSSSVLFVAPALLNVANTFTAVQTFSAGLTFSSINTNASGGNLLISDQTPTVTAGFNTGSIAGHPNGTLSFSVLIGVGAAVSTGTVGLPTAANFWSCFAQNVTRPGVIQLTASTNNSASFQNFGTTFVATNWTNGDAIHINCYGR